MKFRFCTHSFALIFLTLILGLLYFQFDSKISPVTETLLQWEISASSTCRDFEVQTLGLTIQDKDWEKSSQALVRWLDDASSGKQGSRSPKPTVSYFQVDPELRYSVCSEMTYCQRNEPKANIAKVKDLFVKAAPNFDRLEKLIASPNSCVARAPGFGLLIVSLPKTRLLLVNAYLSKLSLDLHSNENFAHILHSVASLNYYVKRKMMAYQPVIMSWEDLEILKTSHSFVLKMIRDYPEARLALTPYFLESGDFSLAELIEHSTKAEFMVNFNIFEITESDKWKNLLAFKSESLSVFFFRRNRFMNSLANDINRFLSLECATPEMTKACADQYQEFQNSPSFSFTDSPFEITMRKTLLASVQSYTELFTVSKNKIDRYKNLFVQLKATPTAQVQLVINSSSGL